MAVSTDFLRELVDSASKDPAVAVRRAEQLLDEGERSATEIAHLLWTRGLGRRELGELDGARADLIDAAGFADAAGDAALCGRIAISHAAVAMSLGETDQPRRLLDTAEPHLEGRDLGRLVMQRGLLHHRMGDFADAIGCYRRAMPLLEAGDDRVAETRLRINLGLLLGQQGDPRGGQAVLERGHELAIELDQHRLEAMAAHNLGYLDSLLGRTADCLRRYGRAEEQFAQIGDAVSVAVVGIDRAAVLLQAGLHDEAIAEADRVVVAVVESGNVLELGETQLIAARAALATNDRKQARAFARRAADSFSGLERHAWVPLARHVELLAELDELDPTDVNDRVAEVVGSLDRHGWIAESTHLRVIAANRLISINQRAAARHLLAPVRTLRRSGPVADSIAAWTAMALRAVIDDDVSAARRAVTGGLGVLRSNDLVIQAIDLRAHAVDQAKALAEIGSRLAIESGRPRELLRRIEELRSVTARNRGGTPTDELADDLAALRLLDTARREAVGAGEPTVGIDGERTQVEASIRSRRRQATGGHIVDVDLAASISQLAGRDFLEFEEVDGRLVGVAVRNGRSSLHAVKSRTLGEEIESASFSLHRLARSGLSERSHDAALDTATSVGAQIEDQLIPTTIRSTSTPLIIAPAGELSGVAWRLLPSLSSRAHVVTSCLTAWAAADATERTKGELLLVAGPDLDHADTEVQRVADVVGSVRVMTSLTSTVDAVLAALASCSIAHFACHGTFRSDNPLFSSLQLADGPLSIYDLERCDRLPHTIVLSACNAGQSIALQGGALLGLTSALLQLGVATVIAPITPVNDERSIALMERLHAKLAAGVAPSTALAEASTLLDVGLDAAAAAFVCFGS